jgi:flagellar basal body-associated protein FliL
VQQCEHLYQQAGKMSKLGWILIVILILLFIFGGLSFSFGAGVDAGAPAASQGFGNSHGSCGPRGCKV